MEKLTLIPKTDTVTICLPPEWVGEVIVCTLQNMSEERAMRQAIAAEKGIPYAVPKKRGRPRKKSV